MSRRTVLAAVLCAALSREASAGSNRWTSAGPYGGYVNALAIDARVPSLLYAATYGGIFRTETSGASWLATSIESAQAMAISPSDSNVLYTDRFRSVDAGATWTPIGSIIGDSDYFGASIGLLAVDPVVPTTVYAGYAGRAFIGLRETFAGVQRSTDGGATWDPGFSVTGSDFFGASVHGLVIDRSSPPRIYAAVYSDYLGGTAVYASSDGGNTWERGATIALAVKSLALGAAPVVYAGTYDGGVLKSIDGGLSWEPANNGLPGNAQNFVATDPEAPSLVWASTVTGLYRSVDGAATWTLVDEGLRPGFLLVDPTNPTALFSWGANDGVLASTDGGGRWEARNAGLDALLITSVAVDPANPTTVYAGERGRVWRSDDGGLGWTAFETSAPDTFVDEIAVDPHVSRFVYAVAIPAVLRSTDSGRTWATVVSGLPPVGVRVLSIATAARSPGVLYLGTSAGAYKSLDYGVSWRATGLAETQVNVVGVDPRNPRTVWAGTDRGLYRSMSEGADWTLEATPGARVSELTVAETSVWAYTQSGLWRHTTADGWIQAATDRMGPVSSIVVDPASPSIVLVTASGLVFQTRNGGAGFAPMTNGMGSTSVFALAADPTGRRLFGASAGRGVVAYQRSNLVTVPAVASLHGLPPTYFHSDVDVVNTSAERWATITAQYRCFAGSCADAAATTTIPPRGMARFDDIVGSLFAVPGSGGAVEFESSEPIVVTSRLYSPQRPSPTTGMFVPGLAPEESHPRSILTSLSHSVDSPLGSRTNIGLFNPGDGTQTIRISLVGLDGAALGQIEKTVGPRQGLQINDGELAEAGVSGDLPSFVAFVEGDPRSSVFCYAAVIDNQSQDPIFVPCRDANTLDTVLTLPAVASLHGAGGTFFHSDVVVSNVEEWPVNLVPDYQCSLGACDAAQDPLFVLEPGQSITLDDVVGNTFGLPDSGGALELVASGSIVASSRLYTPTHPQPTVGMFVPGLAGADSAPRAILASLSSSADPTKGFRVNVGAFNGANTARTVTFRLFDAAGTQLGATTRIMASHRPLQLNNIFGLLGIHSDVPAAYCLVEADGFGPLYPYAAVIDNQSQDPIFVPGWNDPEPAD